MHDFHDLDGAPTVIDRAESARGEVVLRRRVTPAGRTTLELRVNGIFVMDTRETGSERALATEALTLMSAPGRVLVGGLGLGFTARELLTDPRVERVDVVEIEEALIDWTRRGVVPDRGMLSDPRLRIVHADISAVVQRMDVASYDLVLLDVDNGPGYLVYDDNAALYAETFLRRVHDVLRPGGMTAVWSAGPARDLHATMGGIFDEVEERAIDVRLGDREEQYFLYVGRARTLACGPPM